MLDFCEAITYKILAPFCFRERSCNSWRRDAVSVVKCNIVIDNFVFMRAAAAVENPCSHKYVVTKEAKLFPFV